LRSPRRVVAADGRVLLLNWAPAELCEAAGYVMALGALMPPPPTGAPGPFALSEADALTALFEEVGLAVVAVEDVECEWRYPNEATALVGLLSSGPVVGVIEHAGEEAVRGTTAAFLERSAPPRVTTASRTCSVMSSAPPAAELAATGRPRPR
jgi:hypothetical protein